MEHLRPRSQRFSNFSVAVLKYRALARPVPLPTLACLAIAVQMPSSSSDPTAHSADDGGQQPVVCYLAPGDAHQYRQRLVGHHSANAYLKSFRLHGTGPEENGSWTVLNHFDLTFEDPEKFDWRAWLVGRTRHNALVIGPGVSRICLYFFNEWDANWRQARCDFVVFRTDGFSHRLHPNSKGEDLILQWSQHSDCWWQVDVSSDGPLPAGDPRTLVTPKHKRESLGLVESRWLGTTYHRLSEPHTIRHMAGLLELEVEYTKVPPQLHSEPGRGLDGAQLPADDANLQEQGQTFHQQLPTQGQQPQQPTLPGGAHRPADGTNAHVQGQAGARQLRPTQVQQPLTQDQQPPAQDQQPQQPTLPGGAHRPADGTMQQQQLAYLVRTLPPPPPPPPPAPPLAPLLTPPGLAGGHSNMRLYGSADLRANPPPAGDIVGRLADGRNLRGGTRVVDDHGHGRDQGPNLGSNQVNGRSNGRDGVGDNGRSSSWNSDYWKSWDGWNSWRG